MWDRLKAWARQLKADVMTLWFCARDPRTPLAPKLLAAALAAYALSPIDLIPDFIPVLGYLDEVILLPIGIWICLALIPEAILADNRRKTEAWFAERRAKPRSLVGLGIILAIWFAVIAVIGWIWISG